MRIVVDMKTTAIRAAVVELGAFATVDNLKALGFTLAQLERAVRAGAVRWTRSGHLVAA